MPDVMTPKPKRRYNGPPSLVPVRVEFRCSLEQAALLERVCVDLQQNQADVLRAMLANWVAQQQRAAKGRLPHGAGADEP